MEELLQELTEYVEKEELNKKILLKKLKQMKEKINEEQVSIDIDYTLIRIGITPNLSGYHYLKYIILEAIYDKELQKIGIYYEKTATKFNTTPSRVEKCMRHAIEKAFEMMSTKLVETYFGNTVTYETGKTTNSEFIYTITNYLKNSIIVEDIKRLNYKQLR